VIFSLGCQHTKGLVKKYDVPKRICSQCRTQRVRCIVQTQTLWICYVNTREDSTSDGLTDTKRLPVFGEDYVVATAHSNPAERIVRNEVCLLRVDKVASEWRSISGKHVDRDGGLTCRHSRTTPSSRASFLTIGSSSTSSSSARRARLAYANDRAVAVELACKRI